MISFDMNVRKYWAEIHRKYARESWIDKPTLFAQNAINYFPSKGKLLELGAGRGQDAYFFAPTGIRLWHLISRTRL